MLLGDELCRIANLSLERDLKNAKDINADEEREERRWRLNPTFEDLMADCDKSDDDNTR